MLALAKLPAVRLFRSRRNVLTLTAWASLALVSAIAERGHGGADGALLGTFGGLVLPLASFAVVGAALSGQSLRKAAAPLVAFGASPPRAAGSLVVTAMLLSAVLGGISAAAVTCAAGSDTLVVDVVASVWIAALAGAAYAAWFALGSSFGARGGGRPAMLFIDYLLGAGSGTSALFTPRGNLRSLLGGTSPQDVSQRVNCMLLVGIALSCCWIAVSRNARRS